jgi:hypothetical protein
MPRYLKALRHKGRKGTASADGAINYTGSKGESIEEPSAEQGVRPTQLDDIVGRSADLWDSDLELERFVEDIYTRSKEGRELAEARALSCLRAIPTFSRATR